MLLTSPAGARDVNLTGVWRIRLTPLFESSGLEGTETLQGQLVLYDRDGALGGFVSTYQAHGKRDGSKVSLRLFQQNEESYVLSYATVEGKVSGSDTITGTCFMSNPSLGVAGISAADFLAVRTASGVASVKNRAAASQEELDSDLTKLCEKFGIDKMAGLLFAGQTGGLFVPFNVCAISKNGGGYYLYGETGPGTTRTVATATVYLPVEWASCSSRTYHYTIYDAGPLCKIEDLLDALDDATKLLNYLLVDISRLKNAVQEFYNRYGAFAICSGTSANTGNSSIYIIVSDSSVDCAAVQESDLVQIIRAAMPKVVDVYCGNSVDDTFDLKRSPFPLTNPCNTPVLFIYWLGTRNVRFD